MFEKLIIRNFQKHKKLEVEFDPHITVITGITDAGKSAVLRALRWACLNVPSGDAFISYGKKKTSVVLHFDGSRLTRRRGGSKAPFDLDGQEYRAVGKSKVPDEVSRRLCMSDMNFQNQFDMPFWFSESGGKVSKELNRIVNLDIIDTSLQNIGQAVRKESARFDSLKQLKAEAKERKIQTGWITEAEQEWKEIEKISTSIQDMVDSIDVLSDLILKITAYQKHKNRVSEALCDADALLDKMQTQSSSAKKMNSGNSILSQIKAKTKTLSLIEAEIEEIDHELSLVKECPTCGNPIQIK